MIYSKCLNIEKQFDFGFRVDFGDQVGFGHFFRCYSIAEQLIKKNLKLIFITNNQDISQFFTSKNVSYVILNETNSEKNLLEYLSIAKNSKNMIIDLPFDNHVYVESANSYCNTIAIDDLGNSQLFPNLLINGSLVNEFQNYSIDKNSTTYLKGPKFMILRSEFQNFREKTSIQKNLKKILLTFGGNDDDNLSEKIAEYFLEKDFEITILLGGSYKNISHLKQKFSKYENFEIIVDERNVARLFSLHDLVISSSGITSYELACLGIPSIFIPADEYQEKTSIAMEKLGFGLNFGLWDDNFTKFDLFFSEIRSYSVRKKMSVSGQKIIDGHGLNRILSYLFKL